MISIASAQIRFTRKPSAAPITPKFFGSNLGANFALASPLELVATVTLNGNPADPASAWSLGFMQAQWIETNWAAYRGVSQADGSSFVQMARPPGRPRQACLDNLTAGTPFAFMPADGVATPAIGGPPLPYSTPLPSPATFPMTVQVVHQDTPSDWFDYTRLNTATGRLNRLHEAQLEFAFCTVLVLRGPGDKLIFIKGFYWNVNWQATFAIEADGTVPHATPVMRGTRCNVGPVFDGQPRDHRFLALLTTPQATNCSAIADYAGRNPNIQEATGWANFDVRR